MSGKYQTYPAYKDSGVEWLGEVPEHWTNAPIKYMALEECSLFLDGDWIESKDLSDEGIRYITTGNIGEGIYKEQGAGYITEDKFKTLNCTEVFEGDILISRLNLPIGRACIVPNLESRIITSVDNVIFRPDSRYSKNYLVYLFSSEGYFKHTGNVARGTTMQRISRGLLGNIRVIVPPLSEQQKIAQFLDHETAKIDTLIEKQQRLIELLKEKRQAVISHAVTKGLNPNAPMKDSGVEWLGEVPEHWEISQIKYLCYVNDGNHGEEYPKDSDYTVEQDGVPFIRGGNMSNFAITNNDMLYITKTKNNSMRKGRLAAGDILFMNRGEIGKLALISEEYAGSNLNSQIAYLRCLNGKVNNKYLLYFLASDYILNLLLSMKMGSVLTQFPIGNLLEIRVPLPIISEQQKIANFLNLETIKFDTLIEKANSAIELMQERRTALISAAVTGKIDVREWDVL